MKILTNKSQPLLKPTRLSSAWSEVVHTGEERARRRIPTARRRIAAQDSRIGTLDAARNHSVPFASLFRRVELVVRSFHSSELLNKFLRFLGKIAVPLKS